MGQETELVESLYEETYSQAPSPILLSPRQLPLCSLVGYLQFILWRHYPVEDGGETSMKKFLKFVN